MPNKRAFGTDLTNIDNKRGRMDFTIENKGKLFQGSTNIVKAFERQLGQGSRSDFVYGPFHPAGAKKQEIGDHRVREKERKTIQDWENLAVSFRPQYQNQGGFNISLAVLLDVSNQNSYNVETVLFQEIIMHHLNTKLMLIFLLS